MLDMNNSEGANATPEVSPSGIEINGGDSLQSIDNNDQVTAVQVDNNRAKAVDEDGIHGLTGEEITDPNKIMVTVADTETPIVVLYGPPSCGKTMTLVRLSRYLRSKGYPCESCKVIPSEE